MQPDFDLWLPGARCRCCVSAHPPTDCLAVCGAAVVIQVEAAIPMSWAMRPPVRRRPVFWSVNAHASALSWASATPEKGRSEVDRLDQVN
jgi:hypothetical protein